MSGRVDKPLNVRVAEALGWSAFRSKHGYWVVTHGDTGETCHDGFDRRQPPFDPQTGERLPDSVWWEDCGHVPPYGANSPEGWACTGPLLAQVIKAPGSKVTLEHVTLRWWGDPPRLQWCVSVSTDPAYDKQPELHCYGTSGPAAIAELVLALAENGGLR